MKERLSIVDSETASKIDKMTYLEVIDAYLEEKVLLGNDSPIYPYEIQSAKEMGSYGEEFLFNDFRTIVGFEDIQKDSVQAALKPEDRWLFKSSPVRKKNLSLSQINHSTGIFRKHEKETFCINIRIAANVM